MLATPETAEFMIINAKRTGANERQKYDASVASGHPDPTWINDLVEAIRFASDPATQATFQRGNAMDVNDIVKRLNDAHMEGWQHPNIYTEEWQDEATRQLIQGAVGPVSAA
tara:strand:+ start:8421 stop:8756 length:336 start_codon:yes stop_codon:yes gene_type:complete